MGGRVRVFGVTCSSDMAASRRPLNLPTDGEQRRKVERVPVGGYSMGNGTKGEGQRGVTRGRDRGGGRTEGEEAEGGRQGGRSSGG